jgi:hypothetical protein
MALATATLGVGDATGRHVCSQQEWQCLTKQELTAKDHCWLQKGTPSAAEAATKLYQLRT